MISKKKVFTLATTTCGYCKITESFVKSKFPEVGNKYIYFNYDADDPTPLSTGVVNYVRAKGIGGVPFTVMIENDTITRAVRGFDPVGIESMISEAMSEEEEDPNQLELDLK